ncbi:cytochrome c biogenesis protein CcdA, partial [Persicitalea sp.]|uniref:protein-disulfide reductase DsbD n=1 Tax=Persicitalea sp. TaxID=3100273 RepID=UPI0035942BA7
MNKLTAALGVTLLLLSHLTLAQIQRHATWTHSFSKKEVKVGETVDLVFKATIDPGWYMYSNDFDPDLGPMLTEITLTPNASYKKMDGLRPVKPKKKFEEIWQGNVTYFEGKAEFRQTVLILQENPTIKAAATYQTCSNVTGLCVLGNNDFTFTGLKVAPAATKKDEPKKEASSKTTAPETASPATTDESTAGESVAETGQESLVDSAVTSSISSDSATTEAKPALYNAEDDSATSDGSLWAFAAAAFLAGLVALLTPCVFPIIPMTVSFFTKQKDGKTKALIYGLSIVLIYTLIGTVVSRLNGPAFANFLSTHWLPNLLFFAIFFLFGLSFLGLFEIVLPSSFVNKMDEKADQGGMLGVFFMAFTLVLVSFSCTGPIVGSLLVASAGGEVVKPIVGMVAFSSA